MSILAQTHQEAMLVFGQIPEEFLLVAAPVRYNDEIIFPDKVRINLRYLEDCSFFGDLIYIWKTVFVSSKKKKS